ncbi:MAG: hypothetical protein FJ284_03555 [Planctomycetes bacterium]|nr:hypothetical protein [Planctomycetota bacterium]
MHRLLSGDDGRPIPPADIASPGPDSANFPNSPFTLPKGRSYVETIPCACSSSGTSATTAPGATTFPTT